MLVIAQKNAKQVEIVEQTVVGEVNGIKLIEISNSETKAEKQKIDAEKAEKIKKDEQELKNFISGKTVWRLSDISIDKEQLSENKANYDKLLSEVKEELKLEIIFVEDDKSALLAATQSGIKALYYCQFKENNGLISLHHKVDNCESCSKDVVLKKKITDNTLYLSIQADDSDKSDVFYILTFNKQ
jgi:hypothetical protein